ncbi:multidrug effflux MFS transporter [Robbsia sp. Bb-Pol-6]|uniref:Bcr/CflA family efflux transporter n=1 Tax=Robbsia betulipollinis TaxID=2981849 RepID=A0ABT3ZHC3_9BURK|nr:multidrug effflux MFS transporter [Robbsia betulipollinis]MCY0385936.1 multidrug effflux MFS transporter [Robbsia betulipollinis]
MKQGARAFAAFRAVLFAIFLGALAALAPISIDMALPALVEIGASLHATSSQTGLTLSLFMAGFAIGPLFYGPLSDARGRKPTLLLGLALFTGGGLLAMLAPGIGVLLVARLIQGLGAGAGMTIALAIVRDRFDGAAMQQRIAAITVVANVAPIVAPSVGVALLASVHWRGLYGLMAGCGLLTALVAGIGLRETVRGPKTRFSVARLADDYATVSRHRDVVRSVLLNGLGFGWMFAYVAGSPLVMEKLLHVSPAVYAGMFALTGAGIVAGASCNAFIVGRGVASPRVLAVAVVLAMLSTAALLGLGAFGRVSLGSVMPLLIASTFSFGLAAPSATRGALDPLPALAGVTGGLLTSVQMLIGAASSSLVALLFPRLGIMAMSGVMTGCAVLAVLVLLCMPPARGIGPTRGRADAR